jgi:nucleoside-diphosphate-sugar epimerase
VRAEKWKANQDPAADAAGIARLSDVLREVRAQHLVLVSTVDVYPVPVAVDEATEIPEEGGHPYGRHRLAFERFCADHFDTTIVRLPGLFGTGLKKNAIFDLLYDNGVERIHPDSSFQFYDLERLWGDVSRVRDAGVSLVNLTVEPVTMRAVAARAFNRILSTPDAAPVRYDIRSRYAEQFGGHAGYWYDAESSLSGIARFVAAERAARQEDDA